MSSLENGELATGADAKKLLTTWKNAITLDPKSKATRFERRLTGRYAMTNVRIVTKPGGEEFNLNAFVLAIPGTDGAWSVVGASYSALF